MRTVNYLLAIALCLAATSGSSAHAADDSKTIATVDAGLGSCTADFTINDVLGKPVYAANIRVHIAYGFGGFHKFDLQVGTNAAGQARFIGLPEHPKQGLFFSATEGDREGTAFDNPANTCKAQFTIVLRIKYPAGKEGTAGRTVDGTTIGEASGAMESSTLSRRQQVHQTGFSPGLIYKLLLASRRAFAYDDC